MNDGYRPEPEALFCCKIRRRCPNPPTFYSTAPIAHFNNNRAYNKQYFGNQLDQRVRVRFSSQPMRKHMAEYDSFNEEIVIDRRFKRLRRITCWLLMHEMNHVYVGPMEDHNAVFDGGMFLLASIGAMVRIW